MGSTIASARVDVARSVAQLLLAGLADRWAHTTAVARRADELVDTLDPDEREVLLAAAWLHDIGYSEAVAATGFHPLDGATYLDENGWPQRVCGLVAHHSGAIFLARVRDLHHELDRFPHEQSPVSDALTYADQTVGPQGQPMTLDQRMAEMLARRGPDSAHAQVHGVRERHLRAVAHRVEQRLHADATGS
jgi:putative nucleotidyltransferase with HDIG domain